MHPRIGCSRERYLDSGAGRCNARGVGITMPAFAVSVLRCSLSQNLGASLSAALLSIQTLLSNACPPAVRIHENTPRITLSDQNIRQSVHRRGDMLSVKDSTLRIHPSSIRLPWQKTRADASAIARRAELKNVAMEAWDIFRTRYIDNPRIDWERVRKRLERRRITNEPELYAAIDWMLSQAHDQFTRFLPRSELDSMKMDIDGEMCGVGIVFAAEVHGFHRGKRFYIKDIVPHSPASEAGLSRGDEITAIDMESTRWMSVNDATNRLLGNEGEKISLSFVRCDDQVELTVTLTRKWFTIPTVTAEAVLVPSVGRVAYLQIREFAASTALQARRSIRRLLSQGAIQAYVIDLRENAGGLIDQAVEFAKVFLDRERVVVRFVGKGDVVTTEKSNVRWFYRHRVRVRKAPLIVLVDDTTASASELVAAALRDNCRAVIVGSCTYGKGSVQAISQLSDGAGVSVTVAHYRTPSNAHIETGRGLSPDLYRPNLPDDVRVVEKLFAHKSRRLRKALAKLTLCAPPDDTKIARQIPMMSSRSDFRL